MNLYRIIGIILICSLSACAHAPIKQPNKKTQSVVLGVVLYEQALSQGGTLALTPFKAGPKAEANDELDQISTMVIKGLKDYISLKSSNLQIVDADKGVPKLGLGGFVKEFSKHDGLMKDKQYLINLEGELWLTSTGERVLSFSVKKTFDPAQEKTLEVAESLGQGIGEFILKKQAKGCVESSCS